MMKKREKVKVCFKMNNRHYLLFTVIQMGGNGVVDLKITDYYNHMLLVSSDKHKIDKGYITEKELENTKFVFNAEMSYHKDGSFLHKTKDFGKVIYTNPYGEGERWTSTDQIVDIQPIFFIAIRRMDIYNKPCVISKLKSKESSYICENDELFEKNGTYLLICYIRNKTLPFNSFTTSKVYSDIITSLNDELDLCVMIQRFSYPTPKPYYSDSFKCMVTPYLGNSINFCSKNYSKNEIYEKLRNSVFNPTLNEFLRRLNGGQLMNFTKDRLLLIDQIDLYYDSEDIIEVVDKPTFIGLALKYFDNKLIDFNNLSIDEKQKAIHGFNFYLSSIDSVNKLVQE